MWNCCRSVASILSQATNSSNSKLQTASLLARQFHNCNGNNERLPGIAINIAINQNVRFMCSTNCKKLNLSTALFSIHLSSANSQPVSVRNSRRFVARPPYRIFWATWVCSCCFCCSLSLHRLKAFIITNCVNIGTPSKSLCICFFLYLPSKFNGFVCSPSEFFVDTYTFVGGCGWPGEIVAINEIHIYKRNWVFNTMRFFPFSVRMQDLEPGGSAWIRSKSV